MASYVIVELDTTAPQIEIYAPGYTTKDVVNIITIVADEAIDNYQEIYVIDSEGARNDYTFEKSSSTELTGLIKFSNMSGIVTIYARVRDTVGNYSNLVSKSLQIKESLDLLTINIKDKHRPMQLSEAIRPVTISATTRNVSINSLTRGIEVKDE